MPPRRGLERDRPNLKRPYSATARTWLTLRVRWRTAARRARANIEINDEETRADRTRRVIMANTLAFIFGIIAPVAGVSWLVFLH